MSEKNTNPYWPSKDDPFGEVHCNEKYDYQSILLSAMTHRALQEGKDILQAGHWNRKMHAKYGDTWLKAKAEADYMFLNIYRTATKKL